MTSKLKRRNAFIIAGLCVASGVLAWVTKNPYSRAIVRYGMANPASDVRAALKRGDRRFMGVYGYSLATPGMPSTGSGLVGLYGINPIKGTTDGISNPLQGKFQEVAYSYAERYNTLLAQRLLSAPDSKTRSLLLKARREFHLLELSDPSVDAVRALYSGAPHFLNVTGEGNWWEYLSETERSPVYRYPQRFLLGDASLFENPMEAQRFRRIFHAYVIPYNKALLELLKQQEVREAKAAEEAKILAAQEPTPLPWPRLSRTRP